jgi:hypothetical protein
MPEDQFVFHIFNLICFLPPIYMVVLDVNFSVFLLIKKETSNRLVPFSDRESHKESNGGG